MVREVMRSDRKGRLIGSPEFLSCVASTLSSPADFARIKIRSTHPRDNQKAGVLRETTVTSEAVSPIEQLARERKREETGEIRGSLVTPWSTTNCSSKR